MPETPVPEQDPVTTKSLSLPLVISALLLLLTLVWAMADEVYFLRPWKQYQARFARTYKGYLLKLEPVQGQSEETIRKSAAYQKLAAEIDDARKASAADVTRIGK